MESPVGVGRARLERVPGARHDHLGDSGQTPRREAFVVASISDASVRRHVANDPAYTRTFTAPRKQLRDNFPEASAPERVYLR